MSSRQRCRRGPWTFPWGPYPRQAGPLPPRARSPQDDWCDPLWEQQHWRARGRMHLPGARQPRPFPGPADILQNEENWIRSSQNRDVPPPPWMYREDQQSHKIPQLRHRDFLAQPEFLSQEQRPAGFPWEQEASWDNCFPRRHYGPRRRRYRLLRPIQQETADCSRSPRSSQGYHPSCKPSRSCSPESQPGVREQLAAPQSPAACRNSLQSQQQVGEGQLVASSEAPRQPGHAEKSPEKSPGTDPQAAEQEPAAGAKPVRVHLFPECRWRDFHPGSCPARGIRSTCVTPHFSLSLFTLVSLGQKWEQPDVFLTFLLGCACPSFLWVSALCLSCLPAHPCLMLLRVCRLSPKEERELQTTSSSVPWSWSQSPRRHPAPARRKAWSWLQASRAYPAPRAPHIRPPAWTCAPPPSSPRRRASSRATTTSASNLPWCPRCCCRRSPPWRHC
ncbi:uncharacterized protein LOC122187071 isoform X2 [Lagopus leucura]|uniref:uncharacterized protein LOC122187071 isoform X2 n=1 Tax=Lagopus leucura TaxID=30410 RepID=UPI001C66F3AA|nr:uncharacterized protein LOC122187071 isoform X2 [Lagopus leucura]XP_042740232.1 uncharacterized protein LOC122187071 isoform X2 [Lagopus leucura]XP_042740233.1 uncharacterized protein LOC122187071 isoform X2 [Lagopus leucura]